MKILITGCNGQLGNEMQLLEKECSRHQWFNTDVAELDITNQEAVEQFVADNDIDGIVNCAAYTAVDKAEDNDYYWQDDFATTSDMCFINMDVFRKATPGMNAMGAVVLVSSSLGALDANTALIPIGAL